MRDSLAYYDSYWLDAYIKARSLLNDRYPERLGDFDSAMSVLRSAEDFETVHVGDLVSPAVFESLQQRARSYSLAETEPHELGAFGRLVVHDDGLFTQVQRDICDRVGELVGEPVEPSYNFLSMYLASGRCPTHLDAPGSKWTVDLCLERSRPWPLHVSHVVDWPIDGRLPRDSEERTRLLKSTYKFESHEAGPGESLVFCGSNQWHYREPLVDATSDDFCTLLFFHFIPAGSAGLTQPQDWADIFGIDEFAELFGAYAQESSRRSVESSPG